VNVYGKKNANGIMNTIYFIAEDHNIVWTNKNKISTGNTKDIPAYDGN